MATQKISATDAKVMEEFGFDIGEPPAFAITRKSKHAERFDAAIAVAKRNPGRYLKMITYPGKNGNASAGNLARQINNDERDEFKTADDDEFRFSAKMAKDDIQGSSYSVWIIYYNPTEAETE